MSKKATAILIIGLLLVVGWFIVRGYRNRQSTIAQLQTEAAVIGDLQVSVEARGAVRANQTAQLNWQTSGYIEDVNVKQGDNVQAGMLLGNIGQTSLPQSVILAQADLLNAQKNLDDLINSQTESARAQKAVEDAQQALDDVLNPELDQADAQQAVADAQKSLDDAQRNYEILVKPASQSAIEQTHANLQLAEKRLDDTDDQIARIRKKLKKPESAYLFFESRELYKKILDALENRRIQDQRKYEDAKNKYDRLLKPPDANDVALAEAAVNLAQAKLAQAETDLKREQAGPTQAEIALRQAQLADAQREWERLKDGPTEDEIGAAQAKVAAAQAGMNQARITAPYDGAITEVFTQPGDQVFSGDAAFRLDDLSHLMADVNVSEIDINKVQVGQTVVLTFDSIRGQEFHGQVVEVPAVGEDLQGVTYFPVVVELMDADENVHPGITTTANIVVNDIQNALLVPNRSIRFQDGQRVVFVLRDGQATPMQVSLGSASTTQTQVLDGDLQAGDQIVLNPPEQNSSGTTSSQ